MTPRTALAHSARTLTALLFLIPSWSGAAPASRREAPMDPVDTRTLFFVETNAAAALAPRVVELGGEVVHTFENLDGVSVLLPAEAIEELARDARVVAIQRSRLVQHAVVEPSILADFRERGVRPRSERTSVSAGGVTSFLDSDWRLRPVDASSIGLRGDTPVSFLGFERVTQAGPSGEEAGFGEGVVVVVIDSGVYPDHPLLEGNVIGGINLVPPAEEQRVDVDGDAKPDGLSFDWDALENDDHGTFCAGLIAGHAELEMPAADPFAQSIAFHAPESVEIDGDIARVWLAAPAPRASIFAVKIFPFRGGFAPDARVAQALDILISAKRRGELDVDVVSMSLSGPVLDDGRCPLDRMVDAATRAGITCVVAAGNAGPALVSVGSPGSARSALTVGGAIDPLHVRVALESLFGLPLGAGTVAYPHDLQMVDFSGRGLTADGRVKPELVASGLFAFSATLADFSGDGIPDAPSFGVASGTSFSTPTVAGTAALCVAFAESRGHRGTAPSVAHALTEAAGVFSSPERVSARKQGNGFVRVPGAFDVLSHGGAGAAPRLDPADAMTAQVSLARGNANATSPVLHAGETFDLYVDIPRGTGEVRIVFPEVRHEGPENPVLGDELQLTVHSAQRGGAGDYVFRDGTLESGNSFEWPFPEPGTFRVTMAGAPLNYGDVQASVEISSSPLELQPSRVITGRMKRDEVVVHTIDVPPGLAALGVRLVWEHDWTKLPTYDLDMFVQTPDGVVPAATLSSPELAWVEHPTGGAWRFHLADFSTVRGTEPYRLEVVFVPGPAATPIAQAPRPEVLSVSAREGGEVHDIRYAIPARGPVAVEVFDVSGRRVQELARELLESGTHSLAWDGRDAAGARVTAGVYFLRVMTEGGSATRKLVVVR